MSALAPCLGCGTPSPPGASACPSCGQALGSEALPPGTSLGDGRYMIEGVLGRGGFGITYVARHTGLGHLVALKELFPAGARRNGLAVAPAEAEAFARARDASLAEGRTLARLALPGVVTVLDAFEENETAYLVMVLLQGETLERRLAGGPLAPAQVRRLADGLAETLEAIHAAGLLHRDIKPGNVFLPADGGDPVLIDFGSTRAFDLTGESRHDRLVSPGYSPLEQYAETARFGPPTDLYALAATLWHATTGQAPPAAPERASGSPIPALPRSVPASLAAALTAGLAIRAADRPASAAALRAWLRRPTQASRTGAGRWSLKAVVAQVGAGLLYAAAGLATFIGLGCMVLSLNEQGASPYFLVPGLLALVVAYGLVRAANRLLAGRSTLDREGSRSGGPAWHPERERLDEGDRLRRARIRETDEPPGHGRHLG